VICRQVRRGDSQKVIDLDVIVFLNGNVYTVIWFISTVIK